MPSQLRREHALVQLAHNGTLEQNLSLLREEEKMDTEHHAQMSRVCVSVYAQGLSCLTLCDLMDCSPPGSSCPWRFSGKNPSSGDLHNLGIEPVSPALAGGFFITEPPGKLI